MGGGGGWGGGVSISQEGVGRRWVGGGLGAGWGGGGRDVGCCGVGKGRGCDVTTLFPPLSHMCEKQFLVGWKLFNFVFF